MIYGISVCMMCRAITSTFTREFYISSPAYCPVSVILKVSLFPWMFHHPLANLTYFTSFL